MKYLGNIKVTLLNLRVPLSPRHSDLPGQAQTLVP